MTTPAFDWKKTPLKGRFLIEASAGTGKTFSLIRFIVRLIMEGETPVKINEILAVTFTVAATAELKKRLKELLLTIREARETSNRKLIEKEDLCEVYELWETKGWLTDSRLDDAIAGLADAQVFTIHGFCQAMLTENEFSGSSGFNFEVGDDQTIREQCVKDFLSQTLNETTDPKLKKWLANPDARWEQKLERISSQSKSKENPTEIRFFDYYAKVNTKETVVEPVPEELKEKLNTFLAWTPNKLTQHKNQARLCTFTDLLTSMQQRLDNKDFVDTVRKRYKAVLIDEFQDTDPVQYSIFKTLFLPAGDEGNYPSTVVFVGDPKQSIYLFRDADVKTYEKAKADLGDTRSLNNNYRSSPVLLAVLNAFFSMQMKKSKNRHAYFDYQNVLGAQRKLPLLRRAKYGTYEAIPVLSIWTETTADNIPVDDLRRHEAQHIVQDICSLLDGTVYKTVQYQNSDKKNELLQARDIAILVRQYKDANAILPLLQKQGIGYRLDCDEDVFETDEALEILDILKAMQAPDDIKRVNWARATRIFHERMSTIAFGRIKPYANDLAITETQSNEARSKARSTLIKASQIFNRYGVSAAFSEIFETYQTDKNVLAEPNGDVYLTNYRHILELLQEANAKQKTLPALIRWFAKAIKDADTDTPDNRKVRPTGNNDRITIMSIHKSKGLEFPVVYLAGAFNKPEGGQKSVAFRQTDEAGNTTLWLSHQPMKLEEADEVLDTMGLARTFVSDEIHENERIAYVAMTRASQRVVLPIMLGYIKGKKFKSHTNNAYYRLMRGGENKEGAVNGLIDELKDDFAVLFNSKPQGDRLPEIIDALRDLTEDEPRASDFIEEVEIGELVDLPTLQKPVIDTQNLKAAEVSEVVSPWVKTSFTAITKNAMTEAPVETEGKEADEEPDEIAEDSVSSAVPVNGFFTVKNAATFGDMVHQLFERADFELARQAKAGDVAARSAFEKLVRDRLQSLEEWKGLEETLVNLLLNTLTRNITLSEANTMALADLSKSARSAEMEFTMKVNAKAGAQDLKRLLDHFDSKYHIKELQDRDLEGFLTGFVDLAFTHKGQFWVLDWKTNKRGIQTSTDVTDEWVSAQMKEHAYTLQYLIYLVALKRYLESRGITKKPAGAIYVFVAAAVNREPQANAGLWIDPVPPSLIDCLDQFFHEGYDEKAIQEAATKAARGM